jgi:hypothetical protein
MMQDCLLRVRWHSYMPILFEESMEERARRKKLNFAGVSISPIQSGGVVGRANRTGSSRSKLPTDLHPVLT